MNKKLLAVAVAGALAAPGVALAQSSVTISGYMKGGLQNHKISDANPGRIGNKSESRVDDHASRILFNVVEDLGSGLQAVGQFDLRMTQDATPRLAAVSGAGTVTASPAVVPQGGGNSHVGLRSKSWGSIRFGRQDTHYGNAGDTIASKAGALGAFNAATFDVVQRPGATGVGIANASRTPNLMWYDSPKWGGFGFMIGYSTNPIRASGTNEVENDLGRSDRKGKGWTFNPVYSGGNWEVAWSHWNAKSDWAGCASGNSGVAIIGGANIFSEGCANVVPDEKSDSIRGHYIFPMGLRIGLAYNRSKVTTPITVAAAAAVLQTGGATITPAYFGAPAGAVTGDRTAWALPISYNTGAHTFYMTYTRARDSKDTPGLAAGTVNSGSQTGARLVALAYNYDLSKRTAVGVSYAHLSNRSFGRYGLFYQSDNAFGGSATASLPGEDQRLFSLTMRHGF